MMNNLKYTMCMSGGGEKGSVQVGYVKYFAEKGIKFSKIIGTSTGALQGAMYAQDRVEELEKIWLGLEDRKCIYKNWTFGWLEGFFRRGLYNPKPLKKLIDRFIESNTVILPFSFNTTAAVLWINYCIICFRNYTQDL